MIYSLIETYPQNLQFIFTGSSARKLKITGSNLLAGRANIKNLHPLSMIELPSFDIYKALTIGTLPKPYLSKSLPYNFLESYVGTYLKEEIQIESNIRRLDGFQRFLELAAQANGTLINYTKIGRDCKLSSKTIAEYFSILVDTLIAIRLDPWNRSIREQIRRQPKFYFFDNGILNTLRGEINIDLKPASYRYGNLFETLVINEVFRLNDYLEKRRKFFHWRTENNFEVDLIIDQGFSSPPIALEIKSSSEVALDDLSGLVEFKKFYPNSRLICLCQTPRKYQLDSNIEVWPWKEGIISIL